MLFFRVGSMLLDIMELCRNCERSKVAVRRSQRRTFFILLALSFPCATHHFILNKPQREA